MNLRLDPAWTHGVNWDQLPRDVVDLGAGRGAMTLIQHPNGVVIRRQYRHGGLRRLIAPELFLKSNRAADEYAVHRRVFEAGIPTVEPVGWAQAAGPPFFARYYYYTVYQDGAEPLPRILKNKPPERALVNQIATILWGLFELGIYHQDLNLNNWLVLDDRLLLIDFDKAVASSQKPKDFLAACLARMVRSGKKLGFSYRKYLFLRLLARSSVVFGVDPRHVLAMIPVSVFQERSFDRIRWKISGGRQKEG